MENFPFLPTLNTQSITILMISEAIPKNEGDYFYSSQDSLSVRNILSAFQQAGCAVNTIENILLIARRASQKEVQPGKIDLNALQWVKKGE